MQNDSSVAVAVNICNLCPPQAGHTIPAFPTCGTELVPAFLSLPYSWHSNDTALELLSVKFSCIWFKMTA